MILAQSRSAFVGFGRSLVDHVRAMIAGFERRGSYGSYPRYLVLMYRNTSAGPQCADDRVFGRIFPDQIDGPNSAVTIQSEVTRAESRRFRRVCVCRFGTCFDLDFEQTHSISLACSFPNGCGARRPDRFVLILKSHGTPQPGVCRKR